MFLLELRTMTWQLCLFIFLVTSCSSGQGYPSSTFEDIQTSIEQLEKDFNASHSDVGKNGSIFEDILRKDLWTQTNERKLLLAQMISKYFQLLNTTPKSKTSAHIKYLLEALREYKNNYKNSLEKANDLINVSNLQLNDLKTQRKAVAEMHYVLRAVNEDVKRRRRRRVQNPRG